MFQTYWLWLIVISLGFLLLERLRPWRPQPLWRPQFVQDVVWLALNGHIAGLALASVFAAGATAALLAGAAVGAPDPQTFRLIADWPLWLQGLTVLVAKDFLEWCVHNLLHRVPLLWRFHQVHHSIQHMDCIGNFRFHWMEIIIYKSLTWLPLVMLGTNDFVLFILAIIVTAIGHHNHSNLNVGWGPLNFLINSPRFHLWHHDRTLPRGHDGIPAHGCNFAIVFTCWDWIFGTAYFPKNGTTPTRLGFPNDEYYPNSILGRMFAPFTLKTAARGWKANTKDEN
jgi:sterol desaturase/sphingolipid hydroxylase (fatty acid hydroxylase superfamily)